MTVNEYFARVYAGWLGKCIGVRHGAPVEGWTAEEIKRVYGDDAGGDYLQTCDIFEADDDINGPYFLMRAMEDAGAYADIDSERIARAWTQYPPYEHGFFWWPGYGRPTNYHILEAGGTPWTRENDAPDTGLGARIFIDGFALCCPNDAALAASLAKRAARVQCAPGGSGEDSAVLQACLIALAFGGGDAGDLLEQALSYIPADGDIAVMARALLAQRRLSPSDAGAAVELIREKFAAPRFPGMFHAVPNMGYVLCGLLFSGKDFARALEITTFCGLDTDCNTGSLGVILGVLNGVSAIPRRLRAQTRDIAVCSSVLGDENIGDIPSQARRIALAGCRVTGLTPPPEMEARARLPLSLDFDTGEEYHGMWPLLDGARCADAVLTPGRDGLAAFFPALGASHVAALEYRTYLHPRDVHNTRYDPAFSPKVYPGQTVRARVALNGDSGRFVACAYARMRGGRVEASPFVALPHGEDAVLALTVRGGVADVVEGVGVRIMNVGQEDAGAQMILKRLWVEGAPDYMLSFAREGTEFWNFFHYEISQITYTRGRFALADGRLTASAATHGECLTGSGSFADYAIATTVRPCRGAARVLIRARGAFRYCALEISGGEMRLIRVESPHRQTVLAAAPLEAAQEYAVSLCARGSELSARVNGKPIAASGCPDDTGRFGAGVSGIDARAEFGDFVVRGIDPCEE